MNNTPAQDAYVDSVTELTEYVYQIIDLAHDTDMAREMIRLSFKELLANATSNLVEVVRETVKKELNYGTTTYQQ